MIRIGLLPTRGGGALRVGGAVGLLVVLVLAALAGLVLGVALRTRRLSIRLRPALRRLGFGAALSAGLLLIGLPAARLLLTRFTAARLLLIGLPAAAALLLIALVARLLLP